ncbi:unnamed protein product [Staurois parvus]|uniref:Uncharacterized protein n=1 Tax=Staurois parvus TaxID=386267 RepID=A0ABN9AP23_9NEOB|nr:unnamed protein product [Staurois parvus]
MKLSKMSWYTDALGVPFTGTKCIAIDSADSWLLLHTERFSLVAVVPSRFHFVIIPLTVERGIFSSQEMSRMDLLHRWPPITGPRLESLSS